ncbi:MAG: HAMP domain-containing histidine kinase, partial [Elusimicrobia bacterium]|nr:HAMP domain-containing histidine kinase [Elusimicrobiota bacterium]
MERGQLPYTGREFTTEILMGLVITLYILILHRVHKKLVKLEESRSRLVQLLVHDLKNPITGALGSISSLIQDSNDPHQRNKLLNIALINCRSEITLIDQILEIDRLEMAELSPRKQRVHIQAFLDSCVNEITGTAIFKDIHVSKSNTSSSAHLEADPDLL